MAQSGEPIWISSTVFSLFNEKIGNATNALLLAFSCNLQVDSQCNFHLPDNPTLAACIPHHTTWFHLQQQELQCALESSAGPRVSSVKTWQVLKYIPSTKRFSGSKITPRCSQLFLLPYTSFSSLSYHILMAASVSLTLLWWSVFFL